MNVQSESPEPSELEHPKQRSSRRPSKDHKGRLGSFEGSFRGSFKGSFRGSFKGPLGGSFQIFFQGSFKGFSDDFGTGS